MTATTFFERALQEVQPFQSLAAAALPESAQRPSVFSEARAARPSHPRARGRQQGSAGFLYWVSVRELSLF